MASQCWEANKQQTERKNNMIEKIESAIETLERDGYIICEVPSHIICELFYGDTDLDDTEQELSDKFDSLYETVSTLESHLDFIGIEESHSYCHDEFGWSEFFSPTLGRGETEKIIVRKR